MMNNDEDRGASGGSTEDVEDKTILGNDEVGELISLGGKIGDIDVESSCWLLLLLLSAIVSFERPLFSTGL